MSTTIYVGNLPFSTTADELHDLFSTYGPVESVRLITGQMADAILEAQARLVKDEAESEEGEKAAVSAAPDMPRRPRRRVRARLPVEGDEAEAEPEEEEEAE